MLTSCLIRSRRKRRRKKIDGCAFTLPLLVVCFVAVLALKEKAALGDVVAAVLTGFGAGEGEELGDEEAG